jgi:3-oxoacyl-[acyl-carrier-protein] synthase-1
LSRTLTGGEHPDQNELFISSCKSCGKNSSQTGIYALIGVTLTSMPTTRLSIRARTITNSLGHGEAATLNALHRQRSGLRACDFDTAELDTWIGRVDGIEEVTLPAALQRFDCRNNRLALLALEQDGFTAAAADFRRRYGGARIGVFLGTSTSGIQATELAYRCRDPDSGKLPAWFDLHNTHLIYSGVDFVRELLGFHGPSLAISTACSSSAKVFAAACRHLQAGLCDAALVGGVDSLCLTTLYGFNALQLLSSRPCRPWDRKRDGISIGEAAGFALLEQDQPGTGNLALLGYGESSDAHQIATPHPAGTGAALAMQHALQMARLARDEIDYINLHGTATPSNDASESAALQQVFARTPAFSSTKGWTGHTLGAAGITEAIIACQAIEHDFIPGTLNTRHPDSKLAAGLVLQGRNQRVDTVLSNSFGFGGSNCSLIFGRPRS